MDIKEITKDYQNLKKITKKSCKIHFMNEFVFGMLSLKDVSIRGLFVGMYDKIIGDTIKISS